MCLTCRANQPDGGDHEAHGGHRGEGREAEADHRGHAGVRRRRQQHRVVITHRSAIDLNVWSLTCQIFHIYNIVENLLWLKRK